MPSMSCSRPVPPRSDHGRTRPGGRRNTDGGSASRSRHEDGTVSSPNRATGTIESAAGGGLGCPGEGDRAKRVETASAPEALSARSGARPSSARGRHAISHGLWPSARPRTTRLTLSAARRFELGDVAVGAGDVDRVHVHVRREHRRELGAEAGEQVDDAARARRTSRAPRRARPRRAAASRRRPTTTALPPTSAGASRETSPSSGGSSGASDGDDAGRLGHREVEVRAGDRVRRRRAPVAACRPSRAYQTTTVDRRARPRRGPLHDRRRAPSRPRLHHLGEPVEDLAAVVRGRGRPPRLRRARRAHGVAHVLARGAGDVRAPSRLVRVRPDSRARERAADEQLVRLAGRGEPCASAPTSRPAYGSSPCRPPSRPKPDSL